MKKVAKSKSIKAPKLSGSRGKIKAAEPSIPSEEPSEADLAAAEVEAKEALNGNGATGTAENQGLGIWAQSPEKQERLRELIKLAREQGYLTYDDLHEALPETVTKPEQVEAVLIFLRNFEIDVIEASEVDRYKKPAREEDGSEAVVAEEKPEKLDIFARWGRCRF